MRLWLSGCLVMLSVLGVSAQGSLLLTGGGAETAGGWSDQPYTWALEQSANHSVAIISILPSTSWLAEYFHQLGAKKVQNFVLSKREHVLDQQLYDSLMAFDVIFLKAGEVSNYVHTLKGSAVARAIRDKFQAGGVIAGKAAGACLLAEVVAGDQVLSKGPLALLPGYMLVPHFSQRASIKEMLTHLDAWQARHQTALNGLGIDSKTALCINKTGRAVVYGQGGVYFYLASDHIYEESLQFQHRYQALQLLAQHKFDFGLKAATGLEQSLAPARQEEQLDQTLFLGGSGLPAQNRRLLQDLLQSCQPETVGIVSGQDPGKANALRQLLLGLGVKEVFILQAVSGFEPSLPAESVLASDAFVFVGNEPDDLFEYLQQQQTGQALMEGLQQPRIACAFLGEDVRYAGAAFVANYRDKWAASEGRLTFRKGLGLLKTTTIMPHFGLEKECIENVNAGLPFLMLRDSLAYGLWLQDSMYVKCRPQYGMVWLSAHGGRPAILMKNTQSKIAYPLAYRGPSPNLAAFDNMLVARVDSSGAILGMQAGQEESGPRQHHDWLMVYPNPVRNSFQLLFYGNQSGRYSLILQDEEGNVLQKMTRLVFPQKPAITLDASTLSGGSYVLVVYQKDKGIVKKLKVLK